MLHVRSISFIRLDHTAPRYVFFSIAVARERLGEKRHHQTAVRSQATGTQVGVTGSQHTCQSKNSFLRTALLSVIRGELQQSLLRAEHKGQ